MVRINVFFWGVFVVCNFEIGVTCYVKLFLCCDVFVCTCVVMCVWYVVNVVDIIDWYWCDFWFIGEVLFGVL